MNRGELRTRVRDLTGIYATSLVNDALINAFIEEAYRELEETHDWSSAVSVNLFPALSADSSSPGFEARFHPLLSYRAAMKVLQQQTDDTARSEFYNQEWQNLVQQMVDFYLPSSNVSQKVAPGNVATLLGMRKFVRDLTGEYGSDLPDSMIDALLNQALYELNREMKGASWYQSNTSVLTMATDSSTTPFAAEFNQVLPFTVAAKILAGREGGRWRYDICVAEVQSLREAMERFYFPALYTGAYSNLGELRQMVRSLTGVHSSSALSNETVNSFINQAYDWVSNELTGSSWYALKTTSPALTGDSSQPLMSVQYRPILAYLAARDILAGSEQDARAQFYDGKASLILEHMKEEDLSGPAYTSALGSLSYVARMARDLSGVYDKRVNDNLLNQFVNEAYTELASARKWEWLEFTVETTVGPSTTDITVDAPSPSLSGVRILEVVREVQSGDTVTLRHRPNLFDVRSDDPEVYYSVDDTTISFATPHPESCVYKVRALIANPVLLLPSDTVLFHPKYASVLAYAAAAKVLAMVGDKQDKIDSMRERYFELFTAMSSEYHADQDVSPFSLGDEGLKVNRRSPWFWVGA